MDNMALSVTGQCHIIAIESTLRVITMNIHKRLRKIGRELGEIASTQAERNRKRLLKIGREVHELRPGTPKPKYRKGDDVVVYDNNKKYTGFLANKVMWDKDYRLWIAIFYSDKKIDSLGVSKVIVAWDGNKWLLGTPVE